MKKTQSVNGVTHYTFETGYMEDGDIQYVAEELISKYGLMDDQPFNTSEK